MFNSTSGGTYKVLKPGDLDFIFSTDGITLVPRAGFEINAACPYEYLIMLQTCIDRGWIKPIAYMRDTEYTLELLRA